MTAFAIPAVYLRHLAEVLAGLRVDADAWLGRHGLTRNRLDDPGLHVPLPAFEAMIRDALHTSREPALGLVVGERLLANTHGMVGYAALQSGTLRQAIDLFRRFARLRLALLEVSVVEAGPALQVQLRASKPLADLERPILEAVVLSVKNLVDAITRDPKVVRGLAFPFEAPDYAAMAREVFDADVTWSAGWCGVAVARAALDLPLRHADPAAFAEAAAICQRTLERWTTHDGRVTDVRRLLLERAHGFPSLNTVARRLHTSPRSLHRQLHDAGTSFQQLLDETRAALAVEHLRNPATTVEALAFQLGYTDVANFRRAFRRWTGGSPADWRRRNAVGHPAYTSAPKDVLASHGEVG
jgi:AraC-like DNA-binding protein